MRYLCLSLVTVVLAACDCDAARDPALEMADSLMAAGFYDDAITEYKRFLFFNDDLLLVSAQYANIGRCYAALGEWPEAVGAMDRAVLHAFTDSLGSRRRIDRAVVLMAAGRYTDARTHLEREFRFAADTELRRRAGALLLISLILAHEWSGALELFRVLEPGDGPDAVHLEASLREAAQAGRKSPETALLLSTLLPGAGQVYSGAWLDALNAAVLNGCLLQVTLHNLLRGDYSAGFLTWYFLFRRYYTGNRYQADRLARLRNERADALSEGRILDSYRAFVTESEW